MLCRLRGGDGRGGYECTQCRLWNRRRKQLLPPGAAGVEGEEKQLSRLLPSVVVQIAVFGALGLLLPACLLGLLLLLPLPLLGNLQ